MGLGCCQDPATNRRCPGDSSTTGSHRFQEGQLFATTSKILLQDLIYLKHLNREARAWKDLEHTNILEFLGFCWKSGRFGLPSFVSPYCENGTVGQYIIANPTADRLFIIKGVAQGLKYLHDRHMIHGDLKPNNILISASEQPVLCDFGRSKILTFSGFTATSYAGACRYQAPELFENTDLTKAVDVYAFAISAYQISTNQKPYNNINNEGSVVLAVSRGRRPERPNPLEPHQNIIWPLLENCWK
ncbi:kinase-like protein, partial [Macrolepiota fuliginosa MF-IS2]